MKIRKYIADYAIMILGAFLYTLSFNLFLKHAQIAPGGLTGVAMVINYLFPPLTIGLLSFLLNIPLFLIGLKRIGGSFIINTIITTVIMSFLLDITDGLPAFTQDPLLACIYGGVLMGAGLGLAFLKNSSTGGADIVVRVLRGRFPQLSMGQFMLVVDIVIVSVAAAVFHNVNSALYAIISMYVASLVMDAILYGLNFAKVAYIITTQSEEINRAISDTLDRGATVIDCRGGYTDEPKKLILCAIKQNQIPDVKTLVRELDPEAFLIFFDAHEVLGYGFRSHSKPIL